MKTPSKRPERHGHIQALTTERLHQLTEDDLKNLYDFAEHRMGRHHLAQNSAEDMVHQALCAIIRGTWKGEKGRRPKMDDLRTKNAFLHYVRSAINSVVSVSKKTPELLFIHESIHRYKDVEVEARTMVLKAPSGPDEDTSMVDLKNELFARMREIAPKVWHPTIDEWERTFFWAGQVPVMKKRWHRVRVRKLAIRVLQEIADDLGR